MSRPTSKSAGLFDRRTLVVWAALVGSMTAASALLMVLQPNPIAPSGNISLSRIKAESQGLDPLFSVVSDPGQSGWQSIVIHHSGQNRGNAESLGQLHKQLNYGGLGWHFVVGNGDGAGDGQLQIGFRWTRQLQGVYVQNAISICLVGNGDQIPPTQAQMDQLNRLVKELQKRLNIPSDRVYLYNSLAQTTSPGRLFPLTRFRASLIQQP